MKIVRSEVWNNYRRCVIEKDDGGLITVKGDPTMSDADAMARVPVTPVEVLTERSLATCSNDELVAELRSRKVSLVLEGEVVCKPKS